MHRTISLFQSNLTAKIARLTRCEPACVEKLNCSYSTVSLHERIGRPRDEAVSKSEDGSFIRALGENGGLKQTHRIGQNLSRKEKFNFLVSSLREVNDNKEAVYGTLDAWVAWEENFPLASIRRALLLLEKEQQWHRVIQVVKWMLSKGQGNTMGTYGQLLRALDRDHRAEEAHRFWVKKIGNDLHSVPWSLCSTMIGIYYRSNMLENLTKLFEGLEAFDRKPPEKSIVQKVANAYEILGLLEEKDRVLEKYNHLFSCPSDGQRKSRKSPRKQRKESDNLEPTKPR